MFFMAQFLFSHKQILSAGYVEKFGLVRFYNLTSYWSRLANSFSRFKVYIYNRFAFNNQAHWLNTNAVSEIFIRPENKIRFIKMS